MSNDKGAAVRVCGQGDSFFGAELWEGNTFVSEGPDDCCLVTLTKNDYEEVKGGIKEKVRTTLSLLPSKRSKKDVDYIMGLFCNSYQVCTRSPTHRYRI